VEPKRVRRVVQAPAFDLADPAITESQIAGLTWATSGQMAEQIGQLDLTALEALLDAVWSLVDTETVDRFPFQNARQARRNQGGWEESGQVNTGELSQALRGQIGPKIADHLQDVRVPVLMISGRHDRNVPLNHTRQAADQLPQAELVIFEHSTHFPDIETTSLFVETVLKFLESRPGSEGGPTFCEQRVGDVGEGATVVPRAPILVEATSSCVDTGRRLC